MYYIILAIITLFILEIIYELGHLIGAKLNKVKVEEVSIGMGPKIASKQTKDTIYTFNLIPLGGYTKMPAEDDINESENSFANLSAIRKISIILGGVLLTLLIVFILNVASTYNNEYSVATINNGSLSQGLDNSFLQNDKILKVENNSITECVKAGFNKTTYSIGDTYRQFGRIVRKDINLRTYISELFEASGVSTGIINTEINLLRYIGMILVCINILPIPALSGGQFLVTLLEGVTKKSISRKITFSINFISLIVITALIIFALI